MPNPTLLRKLGARSFALAMNAKDQRLIARLFAEGCEYIDLAGLLEAAQHQAADAGAGFAIGLPDQRKEGRLKRRLLALQKREMQLGKVVPQSFAAFLCRVPVLAPPSTWRRDRRLTSKSPLTMLTTLTERDVA